MKNSESIKVLCLHKENNYTKFSNFNTQVSEKPITKFYL